MIGLNTLRKDILELKQMVRSLTNEGSEKLIKENKDLKKELLKLSKELEVEESAKAKARAKKSEKIIGDKK